MDMYTLHAELVISFICILKFFNTFSQLNTQWDAPSNSDLTDFFSFWKGHWES